MPQEITWKDMKWAGIPPHMANRDFPIWERFRLKYGHLFEKATFDVQVGVGEHFVPTGNPALDEGWKSLGRLRIDAVLRQGAKIFIAEVRPEAGPGAVGSLLVYTSAWRYDPPEDPELLDYLLERILITDRLQADILNACHKHDIIPIVV